MFFTSKCLRYLKNLITLSISCLLMRSCNKLHNSSVKFLLLVQFSLKVVVPRLLMHRNHSLNCSNLLLLLNNCNYNNNRRCNNNFRSILNNSHNKVSLTNLNNIYRSNLSSIYHSNLNSIYRSNNNPLRRNSNISHNSNLRSLPQFSMVIPCLLTLLIYLPMCLLILCNSIILNNLLFQVILCSKLNIHRLQILLFSLVAIRVSRSLMVLPLCNRGSVSLNVKCKLPSIVTIKRFY